MPSKMNAFGEDKSMNELIQEFANINTEASEKRLTLLEFNQTYSQVLAIFYQNEEQYQVLLEIPLKGLIPPHVLQSGRFDVDFTEEAGKDTRLALLNQESFKRFQVTLFGNKIKFTGSPTGVVEILHGIETVDGKNQVTRILRPSIRDLAIGDKTKVIMVSNPIKTVTDLESNLPKGLINLLQKVELVS